MEENNGQVVTLDIETYQQLLQELQDCKLTLHKLAALFMCEDEYKEGDDEQNQVQADFSSHNSANRLVCFSRNRGHGNVYGNVIFFFPFGE